MIGAVRSTLLGRGAAAALAVAALAGCGDDSDPPPGGRGVDLHTGSGPTTTAPPPEEQADERFGVRPLDLPPGEGPTPEAPPHVAPEANQEPERDLEAELRALAGDAAGCFEGPLEELPELVQIDLVASVSAYGVVTAASASGSGVPQAARACLGRRIEGGRFRAPVPEAPRTVRAQVVLRRERRPPDPAGPRPP